MEVSMQSYVQIEDDGKPFDYTRVLIAYSEVESIDADKMISALLRFEPTLFAKFTLEKTDVKIFRLDNRQYSVDDAIVELRREERFAKVTFERDVRLSPLQAGLANDRYFANQWALRAIEVEAAWRRVADAGQGRGPVRVAIIDSGAKRDHEDLDPAKLTGTREPTGADFADDIGHGTMLAGTVAAVANNTLGIAGVASNPILPGGGGGRVPDLRLFAVKFDDMRTPPSAILAILGVLDAIAQQVRVINASWHLLDVHGLLKKVIDYAGQPPRSILFVAAAGNDGSDNTRIPVLPATFGLPNILPVMASNEHDEKAGFSNYGTNVDLAAPGTRILSTSIYFMPPPVPPDRLYNPAYREVSGTSVAAAHVTGAAALLLAIDDWSPQEIRDHLVASADRTPGLRGTCRANGRLNIRRAVEGPFAVVSPGAGVQLPRGGQHTVQWTSAYDSPVVNTVEISIIGVVPPLTPANGVPNTGSFQVTLPPQARANAVLRIRCLQKKLYADSQLFDIV
jgi:subtilisin family serine protease